MPVPTDSEWRDTAPVKLARATRGKSYRGLDNALLYAFFSIGLLLQTGAFTLQLSGRDLRLPVAADWGSPISQLLFAILYLVSIFLFISSGRAGYLLSRTWPILLFPILAVLSAFWSPDPLLTLRRSIAFGGTIMFGLSLASFFSLDIFVRLFVRVLTASMLFSLICAIVFPIYGVHQPTDAIQFEHAGLWRGIFAHRTILGYMSGLAFALILIYGRNAFKYSILRYAALLVSILCLVRAASGAGYLTAIFVPMVVLLSLGFRRLPSKFRLIALMAFLVCAILFSLFLNDLLNWILWLLDKEPNLTGRVPYWEYIYELTWSQNPIIGLGYYAGFAVLLGPAIEDVAKLAHVGPHNGFLEIFVAFGLVGIVATAILIGWLFWRSFKLVTFGTYQPESLNAFPLAMLIFALGHNLIESTIIAPNNTILMLLAILTGLAAKKASSFQGKRPFNPAFNART
jgi:O-antigen ligase